MTATTPGCAAASPVSMPLMAAWVYGLRTIATCRTPGSVTSSVKTPEPVRNRGSSTRLTGLPTYRSFAMRMLLAVMTAGPADAGHYD